MRGLRTRRPCSAPSTPEPQHLSSLQMGTEVPDGQGLQPTRTLLPHLFADASSGAPYHQLALRRPSGSWFWPRVPIC